ncbi:hypothetical protein PENFLA_c112G02345, partial [Penicillium flavigenum]
QKREAIEAKLAAYDYNHQYIKKALDEASDRLATKHASIRDTHTAVSALNTAVANVDTAKESVKPTLRLLKLRYYRRSQRQQLRELEDKRRSLVEEYIHKRREVETLEYEVAREQKPDYKEWEEAQKARRLLEQRLAAEGILGEKEKGEKEKEEEEEEEEEESAVEEKNAVEEEEEGPAAAADAVEEEEEDAAVDAAR